MSYSDWGFRSNPFETNPLPPSEMGSKLLVGRDDTIKNLKRRLDNGSKLLTVEGLNGIGKTSVINVMVFRAFCDTIKSGIGPLYIPCRTVFQLDETLDPTIFRQKILIEVAQTLLERHADLPVANGRTRSNSQTALDRYLNSPNLKSISGGIGGFSAGLGMETNTGRGFETSGLEKSILNWLEELFPTSTSGAVVCTLDNLELLQTSQRAREMLELLRDTLFSIRGIRWVLCGSQGIIHGIAASPRLDGRLHKPLILEDLPEEFAGKVFDNRVKAFRENVHSKLPIDRSNFIELYDIMRGNLRSVLSECDEFCTWVSDRVEDRDEFQPVFFEDWLEEELDLAYNAVRAELRPSALKVFETACQFEIFAPSDCIAFGYAKPSAMRPQIKTLESVGLLQTAVDEGDKRRKSIQVTAKGWKVRAYLDFFSPET